MLKRFKKKIFNDPISFDDLLIKNRIDLFKKKDVQLILDIGANQGQYAESVLAQMSCRVISFEPLKKEYDIIKSKLNKYANWEVYNFGLGNKNEEIKINISENSFSSSILNLNRDTINYDPKIGYISSQNVEIKKLESIWDKLNISENKILIKIDTQGYEYNVIEGCSSVLKNVIGLQIEMSLVQLYEGEMLFEDLYKVVKDLGFELYLIEPGYKDPKSGKLLQIEAIFFRKAHLEV